MIRLIAVFIPFFVIILNSCGSIMFDSTSKQIVDARSTKKISNHSLVQATKPNNIHNLEYLENENKKLQELNNYYAYKIKSLNYTLRKAENDYVLYNRKTSDELNSYKIAISMLEEKRSQEVSELKDKYLLSESSRQMLLKNYQQASQLYQQLYDNGHLEIQNDYCDSLYYSAKQRNRSEYDSIINELTLAITICDHKEAKSEYTRFTKTINQTKNTPEQSTSTSSTVHYSYNLSSSHRSPTSNKNRSNNQTITSQTTSTKKGCVILCCDGSVSHSQHRRGTCSHHHGVCDWNYCR